MSKSRSLNRVEIIGNLTRDPVLKTTSNGITVCTFGVATNSRWKDSDGNEKERAEFHNIVAWNKLAEVCAQILSVGMLVYLQGELRTRTLVGDNGEKKYRTEIKLDDMILLDSKGKQGVGVDEAKSDDEFDERESAEESDELMKESYPEDEIKGVSDTSELF